jgi:ribosome-binding factor A
MTTIKQERAARLIQEIITELLMGEVTDPALQDITVTGVTVDREIEYADIYVHSFDERDTVLAGLERANGFLRRELAGRTHFRRTPALVFHWDSAMERGERIESLLQTLTIAPDDDAPAEGEQDADDDGLE